MDLIDVVRKNEPISTPNLATILKSDPKQVYRDCRKLEDEGFFSSTIEQGPRLLFCVEHKVVLTAANFKEHKDHDLRAFYGKVKAWSLTEAGRRLHKK